MMKLGCMSLSHKQEFAEGKLDLEGFLERAYQLQLDGIDIHTGAFASAEPEYLRRICRQALRRGLALSYIGISNNFGRPADELAAEVDAAKEWIDVAAFMGVPLVRVFAAPTSLTFWTPASTWARPEHPGLAGWKTPPSTSTGASPKPRRSPCTRAARSTAFGAGARNGWTTRGSWRF